MTFTRALHYPWIEISDIGWLKRAVLYWDQVSTIVPEGMKDPCKSPDARVLANCGSLSGLHVGSFDRTVSNSSDQLAGSLVTRTTTLILLISGYPPLASSRP